MATTTISMPTVGSVVRVSIPPEVHNDIAKFQKIQKELLGKLGCLGCCSGWDIRFNVQRQFVLDAKLGLQEVLR